jgi:acyl carrier protein
MADKSLIQSLVYRAIEKVNELSLDEHAIVAAPETVLLGEGAALDSMGFVNFIVALEEELASKAGLTFSVVERLNAVPESAPKVNTVGELIAFLAAQS